MRWAAFLPLAVLIEMLSGCVVSQGAPLAEYYASLEQEYRSKDKFRGGAAQGATGLSSAQISENFLKIAFEEEPVIGRAAKVTLGSETRLKRWEDEIDYALYGTQIADVVLIEDLIARLEPLTGLSFEREFGRDEADLTLLVLRAEERKAMIGAALRQRDPTFRLLRAWHSAPNLPCIAQIRTESADGPIDRASIYIKAEVTGEFRRACLIEEFAQILGLINDSDDVRPSVFNDDQEFIELTAHDEYLLRILYNPGLSVGMTRAEAEPLVRQIADMLLRPKPPTQKIRRGKLK